MEFFAVMFLGTSFYLLVGALAAYVLFGLCVVLLAVYRVLRKRRCSTCGEPSPNLLLIGRVCATCGSPCVSWPYLGETS